MIAVVNYGMGNLRSVEKALARVGAEARVTREPAEIRAAAGIVLPGVGAFPKAMEAVRGLGLDELLADRVREGVPVLGVCLGMQLLFEESEELGGAEGLGLLPGRVEALDARGLKVPQIGWNAVHWRRPSPLSEKLGERTPFYHVHSYAPRPADESVVLGSAEYGSEFASAVGRGSVFGVQFHPEKSGPDGLRLLASFSRLCSGVAVP